MKLYRGYNKDYPNWGMREGQNHIWTTDDLDYAIMYANEFDNGGVVEFEIDESKVKYASEYDYEDILDDEFGADPIDADNETCQRIINAGYNVLGFDTSDYEVYLLLDKDLIISAKEINYKQEMNEVLKNAGIQIEESWSDNYELYDIYENYQPYNVLMEFENGEQNIWFPLIKPTEYKQALLEFMKMGELVRFPKDKVFKWFEIIMKNTCIIQSITALAGHTQWFPYDDCRNVYGELEDESDDFVFFSTTLDRKGFYDWCKLPDGSDAWSDYGLKPLWDILNEYQENMTAEQVLVLVNRCLDVYHQRGDLASAFIEGGSSSLTKISNESVDLNETPISDEEYDNLKVGNKVVYDDNNSKMIQPSKYDTVVAKDKDTITTQTRHHSGRARTNVKWNKDHFKRKFSLKESLSFEPTDEYFAIGGKEFQEEGSDVYNIMYDGINIGKLAISEYPDGIKLDGLEIYKRFRKKGFGRNVVQKLKDKYKGIYVRALPSAKKFWEKQGHKAYYNKDSGTYDGDLIYEELIHSENSYYGDHTSVILKNPTLRELKEYNLMESRFICFGDIWVFFDASQWIHYQIIKRYPQYKSVDMGFYDFKKKTFYFIKSFNAEDDVSNEFYVEKKMKELKLHRWLLSQPYIVQNFKNFKVEVFGDWVDSPWD